MLFQRAPGGKKISTESVLAEIQSVVFVLVHIINCFPSGDKPDITFLLLHAWQ